MLGRMVMLTLLGTSASVTALLAVVAPSYAETLAQKLGYSEQDRLLIIHADDVGMCHSANRATIDALENGVATCGSIMVPCPWFPEIAAYCREHPEIDLGLHLTLTSEWQYYRWGPVAPRPEVRGLLDEEGFMWRDEAATAAHASPAEVEKELRAQIERALAFGIKPTHLDSHMGAVFFRPEYFNIYIKLAEEYDIPPLIVEYRAELARHLGPDMASKFKNLVSKLKEKGFPVLDYVVPDVGGTPENKKQRYEQALRNLKPGVTEMIVHLGFADDELKGVTAKAWLRQLDYEFVTAPETKKLIEELDIKLVGWRELKKLRTAE